MSGRTRRGNSKTSGAEQIQYSQEASVMRMPDNNLSEQDWQSFELTDALILNKDGKTIENALDVILNGPFIVRGRLMVETDEQRTQLISKVKPSGKHLEISNCLAFSIGEAGLEDHVDPDRALGNPVLWMRGRSAWYEIDPSTQYAEVYRSIYQSIHLYYGILTIYETTCDNSGKSRPRRVEGPKAAKGVERMQEIFARYALKVGNGMTIEDVEEHCDQAATLFAQWFLEEKDQNIWQGTYFQRWMLKRHEGLVKRLKEKMLEIQRGTSSSDHPDLPTRTRTKSKTPITVDESVDTTSRRRSTRSGTPAATESQPETSRSGGALERQRSRGSRSSLEQHQSSAQAGVSAAPTLDQPMPDVLAEIGTPFDSVVAALEAVHGQIYPKREPTFVSVANKLYTGYRFPYFKGSKSGSHKIPIQEVLHYNASALLKTLDSEKWKSEFWDWLQEVSKTPLMLEILKPSDLPYTVVPRNSKPFIPRTQQIDQAASSIKVEQPQNNDNDDSTEFETPSRPTRGVKTPARKGKSTLRPVASTYKRDFEDIESDSEEESPIAKRAHYDDYPNGIQPEHEALSSDEDDKIKLVIRADKIPSTAPQGRDGTWICDEEDCNYVVRGGDAESCQERIEAHFKDHQQHGERMQLALTESTRGHLPINHLLQKIQGLGEKVETKEKEQQEREHGTTVPKPIKRRLLV